MKKQKRRKFLADIEKTELRLRYCGVVIAVIDLLRLWFQWFAGK